LEELVAALVYKADNTVPGIRYADHVASYIRKCRHYLRRQAAVSRSV
jgi:hypothetical protein